MAHVLYAVFGLKEVSSVEFLINSNERASYSMLIVYLRCIKQKALRC